MAKAWKSLPNGCRTWASIPGPTWCYGENGDITAEGIDTTPKPYEVDLARKVVPQQMPLILAAIKSQGASDFYLRALLAVGMHESRFELPSYGDCRKDGVVVPCGTPGADAPRSVGYYQMLRSTADAEGVSWDQLAASPAANHIAALRLANHTEAIHGQDFPSLVAVWNAGGVYAKMGNQWGVRMWNYGTLTEFVRYWNAAGVALREGGSSDSGGSGGGGGGGKLVAAAGALLFVLGGGLWLRTQRVIATLLPQVPAFG